MNYKIITCKAENAQSIIQSSFNDNWQFVSMTAENVSVSTAVPSIMSERTMEARGLIIFILSRNH
jgi:hypothetical protein